MNAEAIRYEGTKPYIFISYSHADSERVLPIVAEMDKRGYRVWYDAGINAGEEWTATLANKIAGCKVFLLFSSASYIASFAPDSERPFCRLEFTYAQKTRKPMIPVLLDSAAFPSEMEFLIGNPQQMRPASDETPEAFAARLDAEPLFQRCRRVTVSDAVVTRNRPVTPSEEFVGREEIMRDIEKLLRDGTEPVILYGAGGIGKSEICRKLFQKYAEGAGTRPAGRLGWAMWRGTLKDTFYGQFLGIEDANIDAHWQKAQAYMRTLGADLLMFLDNADNITETDEGTLTKLGCRFLITSRQTEHSERVRKIAAGSLTPEECRTLYRRAYPDNAAPDDVLDEIINLAGRHTLAVRLLAKTQWATGLEALEMLSQLRESFDLSDEEITYRHTPEQRNDEDEEATFMEHMSRIFDLSKLRETEKGADALRVLQGMSLLASNKLIPVRDVKKWLDLPNLKGLNRAVKAGWLNDATENGVRKVSIHAVITAVVRKNAMPDETLIDALAGRLRLDMIPEDTEVFTNRLPVLEHAIALDNAMGALRTENYGLMLGAMGYLLKQQADYDNALAYDKRALDIEKETLGEEHSETATSYNNIGSVYDDIGDYDSALEYYQKALRIFESVLGVDHPATATSYNNIGLVYWAQGDYANALEYHQKALQIWERVLGTDHPNMAISYNNIGLVYDNQGDYYSALEYYQKALRIFESALGAEHPNTTETYHNIGMLYFEQGNFKQALEWLEKALTVRLKVLGAKHPDTKRTQEWLDATKRKLSGEE